MNILFWLLHITLLVWNINQWFSKLFLPQEPFIVIRILKNPR